MKKACDTGMEPYSTLIPLWYKENIKYLDRSVRSMAEQTVPPQEILLVQDHEISQEMHEIVLKVKSDFPEVDIRVEKNFDLFGKGLGAVLAYGVMQCRNELIARMDTDDISKPNRCEKQLRMFEMSPELAIVGSWIDEFENDEKSIQFVRRVPQTSGEIKQFLKCRSPFNHPVVMFRKSVVLAVGNYAEWKRCEDYDLWYRILNSGYDAFNIQESLLLYRGGNNTVARRKNGETHNYRMKIRKMMIKDGFVTRREFYYYSLLDWLNTNAPTPLLILVNKYILRSRKG